jgi:hypothetical protein
MVDDEDNFGVLCILEITGRQCDTAICGSHGADRKVRREMSTTPAVGDGTRRVRDDAPKRVGAAWWVDNPLKRADLIRDQSPRAYID